MMTKQDLLKTLHQLGTHEKVPGTIAGKYYTFAGIQKYPGRGKYAYLQGQDVIVLISNERKHSRILLFFEPLLVLVNSRFEDLRHGKLPFDYIEQFRSGDPQGIPNIYEYESHYKSFARYIKNRTNHREAA